MIGPDLIQENIITYLKSLASITAEVGNEIRAAYYMGDKFTYPAIRVESPQIEPKRWNGICPSKFNSVTFSVYIFTQGTSPLQCQKLQSIVSSAFRDATISGNGIVSLQLSARIMPAVPSYTNEWRGELVVTGTMYD